MHLSLFLLHRYVFENIQSYWVCSYPLYVCYHTVFSSASGFSPNIVFMKFIHMDTCNSSLLIFLLLWIFHCTCTYHSLSIFHDWYLTWFRFVANAGSTGTCLESFWYTWMSFLNPSCYLGVGLWSVRNVCLSCSSGRLPAVCKSLYLCFNIKLGVSRWFG